MNWKILICLSLFGCMMAYATVLWIPAETEYYLWPGIFALSAIFIARTSYNNYFRQGFVLSLLNCFWLAIIHCHQADTYIQSHPQVSAFSSFFHMNEHPRVILLFSSISMGIAFGLVQGLLAWIAGSFIRKSAWIS